MGVRDYQHYLTQMYGDYMQLPDVEHRKQHNFFLLDLDHSYHDYHGSMG